MALSSSFGHESVLEEFEWIEGEAAEHSLHVQLKEGYLNICSSSEEQLKGEGLGPGREGEENGMALAMARSLRRGTESFSRAWKKRWCVLSQTEGNGTNLLYYKQQSAFDNCEPPSGVLLMEDCKKLYTIPSHPRSKHIFAADFSYMTMLFHPEHESELEEWLDAFQRLLNLRDEREESSRARARPPLKGLPKQKAIRRDNLFNPQSSIEEIEQLQIGSPPTHSASCSPVSKEPPTVSKAVPHPPQTASHTKKVKVLSYKNLSS